VRMRKKREGRGKKGVRLTCEAPVGPIIFKLLFFCVTDIWPHGFYYFLDRIVTSATSNDTWDEDLSQTSHVSTTSAKTTFQTAEGPRMYRF
jgi:hypothetical protein